MAGQPLSLLRKQATRLMGNVMGQHRKGPLSYTKMKGNEVLYLFGPGSQTRHGLLLWALCLGHDLKSKLCQHHSEYICFLCSLGSCSQVRAEETFMYDYRPSWSLGDLNTCKTLWRLRGCSQPLPSMTTSTVTDLQGTRSRKRQVQL